MSWVVAALCVPFYAQAADVTLTGTAGDNQVALYWNDSGADSNYAIYYDTDSDPDGRVRLGTVNSSTLHYTATGLTNATTYYFWVKYTDSDGDSQNSSVFSATPQDVVLSGTAGNAQVALSWTDSGSDSNYAVYYDTDSTPKGRVRLGTVNSSTTSYTATGLTNDTEYWFWVKYTDSDGNDANSTAFNATPESVVLTATAGDGQADLSWTSSDTSSSYQIYYDTDSNPKGRVRLDSVGSSTLSYTATGLTNGTPYWFWVKYSDSDGDYADSTSATVTPAASTDIDEDATVVDSASEIISAVENAAAGDVIYVRGGTYYFSEPIELTANGKSGSTITLRKYPTDSARPVFDFSSESEKSSNRGLELSGNYWYIYGIDVQYAGDNGMHITGNYNTVEFSTFSHCADTGLQLDTGASYNLIKNVDSYYNADSSLENADGFAAKLGIGTGNKFYGCRAWNNLDDGYDGYLRGADGITTTYEQCWAIRNGYLESGDASGGDGNGFKTGGSDDKDLKHNAIYTNSIAAGNAEDGFDHNSNRGTVTIYNSVGYKNGRNFGFSSTNPLKKLTIKNSISYKGDDSDQYKATSTSISNDSWSGSVSVSSSDFESVDIDDLLADRQSDGSLPDVEFFHLVSGSDLIDAGTDVGLDYEGDAPDIGAFESDY
ncbi:pectate lyase [Vibrio sp. CAIM 722]|uniref:Pectate lyase n=1 Tax=Vibrio eleionomae TaxID=2653505 RepID=A0A7X4LP14_9VIBR|nr:pectate lyase [Vibrio eleionomae]